VSGNTSNSGVTMAEAVRQALGEILEARSEAVLLGCDIGVWGGPFRATAGLSERFGKARVLDTPPNPAAILGFSRGLRLAGHLPICELPPELAARAAGAMVDGLGRYEARTGQAGGPLVVRVPVGRVAHGSLADGDSPEAALGGSEGLRVVSPSRPVDAWSMLKLAVLAERREPVVILEPKALYRSRGAPLPEVPDEDALTHLRRVRAGDDLVIVAWGAAVPVAVLAAEALEADGYRVGVVDLRVLVPLDRAALVEAVKAAGRALVVHDTGGSFAGRIAAEIAREAFLWLEAPVVEVGGDALGDLGDVMRLGARPETMGADVDDWVARVREQALATLRF
jgi:2-oxoisovalerate dehydrogenase E1 component beta subunit